MISDNLTIIVLAVGSALYFLMAVVSLRRRRLGGRLAHLFAFYAAVSYLWGFAQVAERLGWLSAIRAGAFRVAHAPLYGLLLLSLLFFQLTRSFLRLEGMDWRWGALGGAWIVALAVLDGNLLRLPEIWWAGNGWAIQREGFISAALIFGWGIFTSAATLLAARAYRRTQQPLHKNRLKYWALTLGFTVAGDALLFAGQEAVGSGLRLLGALTAAYAVLTHHLPDVRQMARRVLSYLISLAVSSLVYTAGFLGLQAVLRAAPGYSPLWVGAAMALLLILLFNPLLGLVQKWVNRLISGTDYDPGRILREYSVSISNILEIERLAAVALGLIHKAIGMRRGALFLVDQKQGDDGYAHFHLRGVRGLGDETPGHGLLSSHNPLAIHLQHEDFPITQYDIDLLARFRGMAADERAWLSGLGMDVYVPIHAKGRWIGLLALGPKASGDRYFDDDLTLLSTLADQTAVALENARLVEDLVRLNRELDRANHFLEHLDRTKSDFISIVSHELRTPLAVMLGYGQILTSDPVLKADAGRFEFVAGLHRGATRMEEIVESMLDLAMIDTRTLKLGRNPVTLASVLQDVHHGFKKALAERQLILELKDLSGLPPIESGPEALRKVFHHLIGNAIKYTPDGGRITVSGRLLPTDPDALSEQSVEIVVGDTGIGIDPRFQELIFTKFYQTGEVATHSSGKTKFKGGGPGLGLTIARGIVEAHGGRIWVESPGYDEAACPGSQFYVLLPLRYQPLAPPAEQSP